MDFLRNMVANTQAHLAGLGTSQKIAIGLCVVVLGGSLVWMFQWSGEPEWVPVLPGQLWTEDEITAAKEVLEEGEYRVTGRQILVPAGERQSIRSRLGQAGALPHDTRVGFEALMKETSPWKSQTQQSREWVVAYGNQLAMDLEGWKNVKSAQVILQMPNRRALGGKVAKPSASVSIGLKANTSMDRAFQQSIAHFVAGATGMPAENVQIVDTNTHQSFRIHPAGSGMGDELLQRRREQEAYFQQKIQQLLSIDGARVSVFAEIETARRRETERTPLEGKAIELSEEKEETIENRKPSATDPGVQPNTSVAISEKGRVEEMENSSRKTEFLSALGEKMATTEHTLGALKGLSAAINVPRSYLAGIFKRQQGNAEQEPTDDQIDEIAKKEFTKIRGHVLNAIGGDDEKLVSVDWFDDPMTRMAAAGMLPGEVPSDSMLAMAKTHARQLALGALAVLSLGMMLMIVRKGPAAASRMRDRHPAFAEPEQDLGVLSTASETIGEASGGESAMEGHEVDEGALQEEMRIKQVSSYIKDDPSIAANLVRRWIQNA